MHTRFIATTATFYLLGILGCHRNDATDQADTQADTQAPGPSFQYLQGTSKTTSADGTMTYEEVDVLAKKTIDSAIGTIIEDTQHGSEIRRTVFTQQPGTLIFDVMDEENTFSGTVTFESDDWAMSNVTYDLEIYGDYPGTLTGTGTWESDTYSTDKAFSNPNGVVEARTTEVLIIISEEDYSAALSE